jgi:hypothetical protein
MYEYIPSPVTAMEYRKHKTKAIQIYKDVFFKPSQICNAKTAGSRLLK